MVEMLRLSKRLHYTIHYFCWPDIGVERADSLTIRLVFGFYLFLSGR